MNIKQLRHDLQKRIICITPDCNKMNAYSLSMRMIVHAQDALKDDLSDINYKMTKGEVPHATHTIRWLNKDGVTICIRDYKV